MKNLNIAEEFEIDRPHNTCRLYEYFISYKLSNNLKNLPFNLKGLKVLDICCGAGMISEYYAKLGANVIGIDLSEKAIERAKIRSQKYNFKAAFVVGSALNLPYKDNSFDIVSVHDGLHHIENPKIAVKEMIRVAKLGVAIIEPAKSLATRISVMLGISEDYEEEGNFVYRFTKAELRNWLTESGCKDVKIQRYVMYYPHKPGKIFKLLSSIILFYTSKLIFNIVNVFIGHFGNKIQAIGLK